MQPFPKPILLAAILAFSLSSLATAPPLLELKKGLIIRSSVQIKPGKYFLNGSDSLNQPVLTIEGNNITVDFNMAILQGSNDQQMPNRFYGLAILIKGNNITLKNARVSGYKIALMAKGCKNLQIEFSNFSYNYRQHLQSNWLREDVSDWMSYHHNEQDEWLRYGAGIYLKDCIRPTLHHNTIRGGQCGLMMMRCSDGSIYANDFSFNSALGIGMYRSSNNHILNNKLDFNVRGYSDGFYYRGQDSAGLLLFEQCNSNVIAYNSATHGGDGFFLWAGQTTMDTGEGGCNDNYIYKNDFSYAPTNGVEVTFSKSHIIDNIIRYCDHGIWGGYSWETSINGNDISNNRIGIAIEHGQYINISNNRFENNRVAAIKLWARKTQPTDWVYAQKRDTRSMKYDCWNNQFMHEKTAFDITLTKNINLDQNSFTQTTTEIKKDSSVEGLVINPPSLVDTTAIQIPILQSWKNKTIPPLTTPAGKAQIRITEWGPYDYGYPIIFLHHIDSNHRYHFNVLGPSGNWRIKDSKDLSEISSQSGHFPDTLIALATGPDVQLNMEYTGPSFTDAFGKQLPAQNGYRFSFRDFTPIINWEVKWYSWDSLHNPNKDYEKFRSVFNNPPIKTEQTHKIDYTWWGEIGKHLPADSFATVATGTVELEKGKYLIGVTADDLVKVYIDGKAVIDFGDASLYKNDEDAYHSAIVTLGGKHTIRIEQVENSGYATLIFYLKPL